MLYILYVYVYIYNAFRYANIIINDNGLSQHTRYSSSSVRRHTSGSLHFLYHKRTIIPDFVSVQVSCKFKSHFNMAEFSMLSPMQYDSIHIVEVHCVAVFKEKELTNEERGGYFLLSLTRHITPNFHVLGEISLLSCLSCLPTPREQTTCRLH